jgi:hypothetical protein
MKLTVGDLVEVKSREEILSTLDRDGFLDGLPFMPEMFKYCGRKFRVYRRAHKTCDSLYFKGSRRMLNTVHLEDVRCDGQAHGACQAECLIFWKEAWLRRETDQSSAAPLSGRLIAGSHDRRDAGAKGCTEEAVVACACKAVDSETNEPIYSCQATKLLEATAPLSRWDLRQYIEDYSSGNVGLKRILLVIAYVVYERLVTLPFVGRRILKCYNMIQKLRGRPGHPYLSGKIPAGAQTPVAKLNLQPGELVRVKNHDAILGTVDANSRNRGLVWSAEMVPYCDGEYRVRTRVNRIIDERTGKIVRFKTDSVILEGVVCEGRYTSSCFLCPRSTYAYWREAWLERQNGNSAHTPGEVSQTKK